MTNKAKISARLLRIKLIIDDYLICFCFRDAQYIEARQVFFAECPANRENLSLDFHGTPAKGVDFKQIYRIAVVDTDKSRGRKPAIHLFQGACDGHRLSVPQMDVRIATGCFHPQDLVVAYFVIILVCLYKQSVFRMTVHDGC